MPIDSIHATGAFDARAVAAMCGAFDIACNEIQQTDQPEVRRGVIAGQIVAAGPEDAMSGTRLLADMLLLSREADETSGVPSRVRVLSFGAHCAGVEQRRFPGEPRPCHIPAPLALTIIAPRTIGLSRSEPGSPGREGADR
jgi:hypothetical protein